MSNDDVALFREVLRKPAPKKRRRTTLTMDTFREEMRERGVYASGKRVVFRAERERYRIPTGAARIVDPPRVRLADASRRAFYGDIVAAARARLALLDGRFDSHEVVCSWRQFPDHDAGCAKCGCRGVVTVGELRAHYERMAADYEGLA